MPTTLTTKTRNYNDATSTTYETNTAIRNQTATMESDKNLNWTCLLKPDFHPPKMDEISVGRKLGFCSRAMPSFCPCPHFQFMASLSGLMCINEREERTATLSCLISVGYHLELRIAITLY